MQLPSPTLSKKVRLKVNGSWVGLKVNANWTLLKVLRERLKLTGTKLGCNLASCGSCTVLLDGFPVYSCHLLAIEADGRAITTIEGLTLRGRLHPIQESFIENGAAQCGYCTPGMIITAAAFLRRNPKPTRAEVEAALSGNICRCCGYPNIVDAVIDASKTGQGR